MKGLHCMADLQGCAPALLTAPHKVLNRAKALVAQRGLHVVAEQLHVFPVSPASIGAELTNYEEASATGGYTLTLLLAESHVCVHTWPELHAVTLDVYVCNLLADNSDKARALCADLSALFQPQTVQRHEVQRGV